MNNTQHITDELKNMIKYVETNILNRYPISDHSSIYLILGILEQENTVANKLLSRNLITAEIEEIKNKCYDYLNDFNQNIHQGKQNSSKNLLKYISENLNLTYNEGKHINTGMVLHGMLEKDIYAFNLFKKYRITPKQIYNLLATINIKEEKKSSENNISISAKETNKSINKIDNKVKKPKTFDNNEVERQLLNINKLSIDGKIPEVVGNNDIIKEIFKTFLKKDNNNVILVGENGTGKTSTIRHIANLIMNNEVPEYFNDKILMEINYSSLISGSIFKGSFESKMKSIIEEAKRSGRYIFFIDDIELLINNRYNDDGVETLLKNIITESKINLVVSTTPKGYSKLISDNHLLFSHFNKIEITEPTVEKTIDILNSLKEKYELYHNVKYDVQAIKTCVNLSKRYLNEFRLPSIAIDILDESGALVNMEEKEDGNILTLKNRLNEILDEKQSIINENSFKNIDKIDELTKKEISVKSAINIAEKERELNKKAFIINEDFICNVISKKTGIPLSKINEDDKNKLKELENNLNSIVIGQNEAIKDVCKIVKRQRLGLSNQNKPSVLMFTGSTGTGKTYLAKKIAEQVFGDEKYLVRFDMSEYSDKMAASKLIGSGSGYIGYENGGLLTEAIKKNKYCVLLLDECEKADETVFNMFLQVFDDGRLTDNRGVVVDFKNVIIILTSNTGAQEVSERNGGIGFNKDNNINDFEKKIYEKAIKNKFKPEFINRIDKIVYFNRLTDDNLKNIVTIEIDKINNKIKNLGYSLDTKVYDIITDKVMKNISNKKEYGARPIIRELQNLIEDKIVDKIIENDIDKSYVFTLEDLK